MYWSLPHAVYYNADRLTIRSYFRRRKQPGSSWNIALADKRLRLMFLLWGHSINVLIGHACPLSDPCVAQMQMVWPTFVMHLTTHLAARLKLFSNNIHTTPPPLHRSQALNSQANAPQPSSPVREVGRKPTCPFTF